jgi:hypothetical protein
MLIHLTHAREKSVCKHVKAYLANFLDLKFFTYVVLNIKFKLVSFFVHYLLRFLNSINISRYQFNNVNLHT